MALSEEVTEHLADVVALQPTKNGELAERWGLDSGSEVHQYLEAELKEYYYRDENSLIRATADAAALVGAESTDGPETVRVPELQKRTFEVVANGDERAESVVSVLHKLRNSFDIDPDAEDVRSALRGLERRGVVEVVPKTAPTFRLSVERDSVVVEALDESSSKMNETSA